jgi:hypothetical protein
VVQLQAGVVQEVKKRFFWVGGFLARGRASVVVVVGGAAEREAATHFPGLDVLLFLLLNGYML